MNMTLSEGLLQKLTCKKCQNYLSVAPIYIDKNGDNICGRCVAPENKSELIRNETYELLATSIKFPCFNKKKGCEEQVNFDRMKEHENVCSYKTWKCPSSTNCLWVGRKDKFFAHYEVAHKNLLLNQQEFKINLHEDVEKNCILVADTDRGVYLIHEKFIKKTGQLELSLENLGKIEEKVNFDVIFKIDNTTLTFNNNRILTYSEEPQKQIALDIDALMKISGNVDDVFCKISFEYLDELLLCTFCKIRMTSPIYKCPDNHISCLDCITDFGNICKSCGRSGISFIREDRPKIYPFSCRWKGCNMKNIPAEYVRKHDRECVHRNYECFDCGQQVGSKNSYFKHLQEKYGNVRIGNTFELSPEDLSSRYLIAHNEVFWLSNYKANTKIICFGPPSFKKKVEYYVHPDNLKLKGASMEIKNCSDDKTVLINVAD